MTPRIYKTKSGYDIITSDRRLYSYNDKEKYHGRIDELKFKPSGRLLKKVPNHIKEIFFQIQNQNQ